MKPSDRSESQTAGADFLPSLALVLPKKPRLRLAPSQAGSSMIPLNGETQARLFSSRKEPMKRFAALSLAALSLCAAPPRPLAKKRSVTSWLHAASRETHRFRGTVTAYCLGPCRQCGTHGETATGTKTPLYGAAINRRYAIPALRHAKEVRVKLEKGWTRWMKIDDTGRGPKATSRRARWVDLRIYRKGHHRDPIGMERRLIEVR